MARKRVVRKLDPRLAVLRPLGAQLRRLRLERNLSQERLAEAADLNYKHLGRLELAKAEAGAEALVRLARALTVPVGELFDTITPPTTAQRRVSPADIEDIATALEAMTAVVDRLRSQQPRGLPSRAPRRKKR